MSLNKQLAVALSMLFATAAQAAQPSGLWSTGYYTDGSVPLANIDWTKLTHVIYITANPIATGALNLSSGFTTYASALITAAHANGVKVLFGLSSGGDINGAVANNESTLVCNIMSTVTGYGFDGVDIDWESNQGGDTDNETRLLTDLRTNTSYGCGNMASPKLLTYIYFSTFSGGCGQASGWITTLLTYVDKVEQINYGQGGYGPETSFNTLLYAPSGSGLPSIDGYVQNGAVACGIPLSKVMVGVEFLGTTYTGATGPYQKGESGSANEQTYQYIQNNCPTGSATYDPTAHLSWVQNSGSSYCTWETPQAMQDQWAYVEANGLGGMFYWALGNDDMAGGSPAYPLLNAVPTINPSSSTTFSACDVNQDGQTNAADVQAEVNEALGITSCTNDINQDGQCNVIDVQRVVNAALGGSCVTTP